MIWLIHFLPPAMPKEAASHFKALPATAWPRYGRGSTGAASFTCTGLLKSSFPNCKSQDRGCTQPLMTTVPLPGVLGTQWGTMPHIEGSQSHCPGPPPLCWGHRCPRDQYGTLHRDNSGKAQWAPVKLGHLVWDLWQLKTLNGACCKTPNHSSPVLPSAQWETLSASSVNKRKLSTHSNKTSFC